MLIYQDPFSNTIATVTLKDYINWRYALPLIPTVPLTKTIGKSNICPNPNPGTKTITGTITTTTTQITNKSCTKQNRKAL